MISSVLFFCAANIAANGGFEAMVGRHVAAWELPSSPATYVVTDGAGRNGSRGLVWKDAVGDRYVMARAKVAVKPGCRYDFGGWIRAKALSGGHCSVSFYFDWFAKDGKWIGGTGAPAVQKPCDWTEVRCTTPVIPPEASYGAILAFAGRGTTGEAVFDDVTIEEIETGLLGEMWSSAYRNAAVKGKVKLYAEYNRSAPAATSPGAKPAFRLPVPDWKWRGLPTEMKDGYLYGEVDVEDLPVGRSPIQLWFETNGVYVASKVMYFERFRDRDPRRVTIDEKNRTLVEGRPFFPIGMYAGEVKSADVDLLVKGGFNCVMPYRSGFLTPAVMDECHAKGLMLIPNVKDTIFGERYSWSSVIDDATGEALAASMLARWQKHPSVLAWYSCDESEVSAVPKLRERQRLFERIDPDHPTWMVLYQAPIVRQYMGAFDVIGTDPYPVADIGQYPNAGDGMKRVSDWTRLTREGVFDGRRPMWQVPQCFDWAIIRKTEAERLAAPTRAPTYEEVRNMAWQCLAGGANGIVFYAYHELRLMEKRTPFEKSFGIVSKVAMEIGSYKDVFLGDATAAVDSDNGNVVARMWRSDRREVLAVVNATDKPQTATVRGERRVLKPLEVSLIARPFGKEK